ncbi:MAG: oxidoreductase [Candidatus Izemoplasma sp.]|nr:oxidoreductase [Candidatus Izemoplasma sp.]
MAKKWTLSTIDSLKGQIYIVTGGNSGIGYETVKALVSLDATVIMASRNKERAEDAKKSILEDYPDGSINIILLDLANMDSIHNFAKLYKDKYNALNGLVNNAGVMFTPYRKTDDGFEYQNGINHLGHFLLTNLLFDALNDTDNSRIVNVSSMAHKFGKMNFDNYLFEKEGSYNKYKSYGRSKLSNLLFTFELDRRLRNQGIDIKVLAAHPGGAKTKLTRDVHGFFSKLFNLFSQSADRGALPTLRALLDPNAESGDYYGPSGLLEIKGDPVKVKPRKKAYNEVDAKKLWLKSEELTNKRFIIA